MPGPRRWIRRCEAFSCSSRRRMSSSSSSDQFLTDVLDRGCGLVGARGAARRQRHTFPWRSRPAASSASRRVQAADDPDARRLPMSCVALGQQAQHLGVVRALHLAQPRRSAVRRRRPSERRWGRSCSDRLVPRPADPRRPASAGTSKTGSPAATSCWAEQVAEPCRPTRSPSLRSAELYRPLHSAARPGCTPARTVVRPRLLLTVVDRHGCVARLVRVDPDDH